MHCLANGLAGKACVLRPPPGGWAVRVLRPRVCLCVSIPALSALLASGTLGLGAFKSYLKWKAFFGLGRCGLFTIRSCRPAESGQ